MTTSGPPNLISEYSRQLRIGEYATTTAHVAKNKTAKTLDKRLQTAAASSEFWRKFADICRKSVQES